MDRIEVSWESVYDLKPYENNPRINDGAITAVMASIKKHGFLQPIVVNQDNVICAGHTRWQAAKGVGMVKVPVVKKTMTEQEFIAFNLADNKTHDLSKWDKKLVKSCLEILESVEARREVGFNDSEIDKIFGHNHSETHCSSEADFGESGKVDDSIDEDALEKKVAFKFNGKQHRIITSKLQAIKKEHGLNSMADALMKALEPYKGLTGPRLRKAGGDE
jgi:hypothetical protein